MKSNGGKVIEYYDSIASTYDSSRFANSYGRYIDAQERAVLKRILAHDSKDVLEIACGTGRLLNFAETGVDASAQMLEQSSGKYPHKRLVQACAHDLPFENGAFGAVFSFHLIMHLERDYIARMLKEVHRVLRPGGCFVFDFPSAKRRKLARRQQGGWHGNTALTLDEIAKMAGNDFRVAVANGILYFPIHIFPDKVRGLLRPADSFLCRVPRVKEYASYIVVKLIKI